jgi:hypothetical protein
MVSSIVKQRYNITRLFAVLLSSYHCLFVCVCVLGRRNLRPCGGSVIDSVMGAFLTQNAGDHLSR